MTDRALRHLIRDFAEWQRASRPGTPSTGPAPSTAPEAGPGVDVLAPLLLMRARLLNCPDPTLWRTGDAHRLLIDTAATELVDPPEHPEHTPIALRDYFAFLDETHRFHPTGMRPATLVKEFERAAAKYPAAAADRPRWTLAKTLRTAMRAEGVDPADEYAADTWPMG